MKKIDFLDTGVNAGTFNMAVDFFMARNHLDKPIFRIYRWKPYCISLGYHQKLDEIDVAGCNKDGIDIVRRETGGRAVYHSEEITYSMIIPKTSEFYSDSILEVYNKISTVLVKALKLSGITNAELESGKAPDFKELYKEKISSVCFSSTSTYEVVVNGKKLVGSAQKRLKDSVLQHGSILFGKKHLDLIDYLNVAEKRKPRLKKMTVNKTITIEDVSENKDFEHFYKIFKINLSLALSKEFNILVEEVTLNEDELLKIREAEKHFELNFT